LSRFNEVRRNACQLVQSVGWIDGCLPWLIDAGRVAGGPCQQLVNRGRASVVSAEPRQPPGASAKPRTCFSGTEDPEQPTAAGVLPASSDHGTPSQTAPGDMGLRVHGKAPLQSPDRWFPKYATTTLRHAARPSGPSAAPRAACAAQAPGSASHAANGPGVA